MALLIKQGLIYDGTDAPPVKQDIFIRGQQIVRLGSFSSKDAETVIDARGAVVTPGFIDLTNAADHYFSIFTDPFQEDLIKQGVTTIIGGNDGFSLAPFFSDSLNYLRRRKSVFQKINVHWQTVKEFLKVLEKRGLGVNFGTLVGYSTLRHFLGGEEFRDLTENELAFLKKIIIQS
ncbi:aminoacylase, partial [Candidatus Jorgensenbacteria bacterium CG_4_10_14_0_8_um_filter_39_13]